MGASWTTILNFGRMTLSQHGLTTVLSLLLVIPSALALIGCNDKAASSREFAQAQKIEIVDYGIYTGKVETVVQDAQSPTGRRRALEVDLLQQTDVIPAVLNTKFGFRFKVRGIPQGTSARLRLRFQYPEMSNPTTGKVSASYEAAGDCPAAPELLGMYWDFVHPWEMRVGKWNMSIYSGDRLLAQRSLTVVDGKEGGSGRTTPKPKERVP